MNISQKKAHKANNPTSRKKKYAGRFLLPEREIRDLAVNLRIRDARSAAICLMVVDKAIRAIGEGKEENGELVMRLVKQVADEKKCKPVRRIIRLIPAAVARGTEGISAACITITCFLEYAFGYLPDDKMAESLYRNKLNRLRRATQSS
ncbi:MAG TPA: hypothetical protein VNN73_17025 [Blastocatellia bacterium]|nr:hypothetical protein [Blastocatellia bacterium]